MVVANFKIMGYTVMFIYGQKHKSGIAKSGAEMASIWGAREIGGRAWFILTEARRPYSC